MFDQTTIWAQLRAGEREALRVLFTAYYDDLLRYGLNIMPQEEIVKDQIQQLFVRLWEKHPQLPTKVNVPAYLLRALRYALIDEIRQQKRRSELAIERSDLFSFSVESSWIEREIEEEKKHYLQQALKQLSERQREVLFLRFYNQIPYREIAEIIGIRYQSVRNTAHRALSSLRQYMAQQKKNAS